MKKILPIYLSVIIIFNKNFTTYGLIVIIYRAVRDAILRLRHQIKAYISLHTYSQLWIYPYSNARNVYPPDFNDLVSVK